MSHDMTACDDSCDWAHHEKLGFGAEERLVRHHAYALLPCTDLKPPLSYHELPGVLDASSLSCASSLVGGVPAVFTCRWCFCSGYLPYS
jgi:hypothetical protein